MIDTIIVLVMTTLLGGAPGNDLLSFIPTESYWKAKDVQVTVPNLLLELNSVRPEDATKPTAVRRLMAIRALGELKSADALNTLNQQLTSKEMSVADYAQRAIDQIQGKPLKTFFAVQPGIMRKDLYMLPEHCARLDRYGFANRGALEPKKLNPANPDDASAADQKTKVDAFITGLINLAETTGNIRADGVTIGLADTVGENEGFFVMYVRGQYDHKAVADAIRPQMPNAKTGGDLEFMTMADFGCAAPSDDLFILASGPANNVPIDEVGDAFKEGKGKIDSNTDLMDVIKTINITQPAWAALAVTDSYKQAAATGRNLKSITLIGKAAEHGIAYTVTAAGVDADGAKSAADALTAFTNDSKGEVNHNAEQDPTYQPLSDLVNSIEIKSDGSKVTATATMKKLGE